MLRNGLVKMTYFGRILAPVQSRIKKSTNYVDIRKITRYRGVNVSISARVPYLGAAFALGLFASLSCAGSDVSLTYGGGSDRYQSYAFQAGVDVPKLPLQLDLDYYHIRTDGTEVLTQTGYGLTWKPTDWALANYRFVTIKEDTFEVTGNEYGASLYLNHFWQGRLYTRLDIGLGDYEYEPDVRPIVAALIAGRVPDQRRYSLGLSQNITEDVYVYGAYDEYRYSTDPAFLASLLIRRFRQATNAASTLVSFPDVGRTLGVGWYATDKLTLDLSYANTDTVIGQQQDSKRLNLSYRVNDEATFNAALTSANSAAVTAPNGMTVIQASDSTILEIGITYTFP